MRGSRLLLVVVAASCGPSTKPNTPRMRMTPKDIVLQSTDAIVRIEAGDASSGEKVGTGFILDKGGLIATNLHVIAGSSEINVKLHDGTPYKVMQIAGVDPGRDLAVLRIKPVKPLTAVRLGDSEQMSAGDQIIAIGNPLGVFDYSVSSGLISQVRAVCDGSENAVEVRDGDGERARRVARCPPGGLKLLQISAPISQGSSGGPLFNQFGEVVGVTTLIVTQGQAINFAVPGNYLKPMVASPIAIAMEQFAKDTSSPEDAADTSPAIRRAIPDHPLALLQGCSDRQVGDVVEAISDAIDIGAPLYNDGQIEACFRIYEGTSSKLERDPPCPGVAKAFGDGLLRASTLASYKEKAWALRDTFDGLIKVAHLRGVRPTPKKP